MKFSPQADLPPRGISTQNHPKGNRSQDEWSIIKKWRWKMMSVDGMGMGTSSPIEQRPSVFFQLQPSLSACGIDDTSNFKGRSPLARLIVHDKICQCHSLQSRELRLTEAEAIREDGGDERLRTHAPRRVRSDLVWLHWPNPHQVGIQTSPTRTFKCMHKRMSFLLNEREGGIVDLEIHMW